MRWRIFASVYGLIIIIIFFMYDWKVALLTMLSLIANNYYLANLIKEDINKELEEKYVRILKRKE